MIKHYLLQCNSHDTSLWSLLVIADYIDVTWASRRIKSPTAQMFVQQLVRANCGKNHNSAKLTLLKGVHPWFRHTKAMLTKGLYCSFPLTISLFYAEDLSKPVDWTDASKVVIQYIPRNMHTGFALLCFVVVIHWLIFPYPSGLLHWHCGNLTIAPGNPDEYG